MTFTKIYPADLDSPRRELSNGGLESVAILLARWQINFCRLVLDVQSSCNHFNAKTAPCLSVLVR